MRTAKQVGGLPEACDVLADEAKPRFELPGGAEVYAEPSEEPTTKTNGKTARVKLAFACTPNCTERKDVWVTLPSNYCYSWATARTHGEGCARTLAACKEASKGIVPGHLIPCARHLGALWCGRDERADRCFGSPWACRYEIGDGSKNDLTGGCQKQSQ
ncbi:hypothetical protein [Labilithrix luteola]|nr:hypothetical protein [Labilithrix luteola]